MKRLLLPLLCCFLFMMSGKFSVSAQDLSEDVIRVVNKNLDYFFPITTLQEKFNGKTPSTFGNLGPETATELSKNEIRNMTLYTNSDGISSYILTERVNTRNTKNFLFSIDVSLNDLYPINESGCYIGYINENPPVINGSPEPLQTTTIVISDAIYMETRLADDVFGERVKLADIESDQVNLMIVRLSGETFFYADGEFIGTYHDGVSGPFSLRYGVITYSNGEVADCSFDNLTVREVTR